MTRFMQMRLALAIIGIVVWGYGVSQEDGQIRLVGIAMLALSLVLRFAPRRFQRNEDKAV